MALVRYDQAKKCLQINPKINPLIVMKFFKKCIKQIFLLTDTN